MFQIKEDMRNEFKENLNDKLEKEVIAFLNGNGGNIYIGISDDGEIKGGLGNLDKIQLQIKDRIKNNIAPYVIGLFEILLEVYENETIVHIVVAAGNEKPYYLREKGMTTEGCFTRVGSSVENMTHQTIKSQFSNRTRNSLRKIVSPKQNLNFSQLKIFYEEKGYQINEGFLKHIDLVMEDGRYNYIAYLLADNNSVSIKVATYSGEDSNDLIENDEFGYCCLIKATKNILNKFEITNRTNTKITSKERLEKSRVDPIALREAIVNAIVHNTWENEYSPKFEIFCKHLSISSSGGLPPDITQVEFLLGFSAPKHPELMRVFKDLELAEQLGTGVKRILKHYSESIYEIYPNFIRVNLPYEYLDGTNSECDIKTSETVLLKLSKTGEDIIKMIKSNPNITQREIGDMLDVTERTVRRYFRELIDNNVIEREDSKKSGSWKLKL